MYQLLATAVDVFHLIWIGVMIAVGLLLGISKRPLFKKIYLIVIGTTILSQIVFLGCPLAILSQALRQHDNPPFSFNGGFTAFILSKYLGINPPAIIGMVVAVLLAASVIFIFIACYGKRIPLFGKKLPPFLRTE